jgi:hypothetical protein
LDSIANEKLTSRYEELREHALSKTVHFNNYSGFGTLVRHGMRDWMEVEQRQRVDFAQCRKTAIDRMEWLQPTTSAPFEERHTQLGSIIIGMILSSSTPSKSRQVTSL